MKCEANVARSQGAAVAAPTRSMPASPPADTAHLIYNIILREFSRIVIDFQSPAWAERGTRHLS